MSNHDVTNDKIGGGAPKEQEASTPISDGLERLRGQVYARGGGMGAVKALSEELDEPYQELAKTLGQATIERIRRVETLLSDG